MNTLVRGYGPAMSPWSRCAHAPQVGEGGEDPATVLVVAPTLLLTVSMERDTTGSEEVHVHAGGQGVWVARMLRALGCRPVICCPYGGESGAVARAILLA